MQKGILAEFIKTQKFNFTLSLLRLRGGNCGVKQKNFGRVSVLSLRLNSRRILAEFIKTPASFLNLPVVSS